jgi:flagella basal body P-ring formation protein FlgA
MHNYRAALNIFFMIFFVTSPGFCLDIQLHPEAVVTKNIILLGDVATISPDNIEAGKWAEQKISRAPAPGENKAVQSSSLISSLGHIDGSETIHWSGAETIIVKRQGIELRKEQLKQIVAEFLQHNRKNLPDAALRFTSVRAPEKIVLPTGNLSYTVTPSKPGIIGSSSFSIIFRVNGKTVKNCTVRGKLEAMAEVATARANIRKGSIITADQLTMTSQDISKLDTPYPSINQVVGMLAKRTIRAGRAIDNKNVEQPPVIAKGEPVKIFAGKGGLEISTKGIAIMNGRLGEYIRVKNISSNKLVYCKVDAPGIVSVEF